MAQRTVLLDTSFVLALENRSDPHHEKAKSVDRDLMQQNAAIVLHWGIVFEIADGYARVGRRAKGLQLLQKLEQEYPVFPITELIYQESLALYRARLDKDWSLTDCVSFVLMRQEGITEALTADFIFAKLGTSLCYSTDAAITYYATPMANSTTTSDADILKHVVSPMNGDMAPDAARAILDLRFDNVATKRIRQLLQKNNRGTITADERITLEKFLRIGKFIDLLQAKARLSLKEAGLSC